MAGKPLHLSMHLEDVDGSFRRLIREAPKELRVRMTQVVTDTTRSLRQRMAAGMPEDDGDLRDVLGVQEAKWNSLYGLAGVLDDPEQAAIAQFNEWAPNRRPFMRPAAQAEANDFRDRAIKALQKLEAELSKS